MYFKQIELSGFKSFADRTIINLDDGLTAVVGPNGCGKSNILDAMRWALGEQKPKALRGAHMQDVIFNGSEERSATGVAEVTLTFDNTTGALPIDFSEVQITRRVYRSGESEYLINKAQCRLRDIQELFMDTGIGTNAYSMIGQGKIGMVLSSKPEDRRFLFEEAAGIIKYKSRKRIAMRKLDQAEQNQLRLGDIVGEVERQMRSLKRQVNAAIRHRELTDQLREFEIRASWLKQQDLLIKIGELREGFTEAQNSYESKSAEMTQLEARHEELSLSKLEVDRLLHARREGVHEIETEMEKTERQIALIKQQIEFSSEQQKRAVEERAILREQATALSGEEEEARGRIDTLRTQRSEAQGALDSQQLRLDNAASTVADADTRLEEIRAKTVESMGARARTQTAIETLTVNINNSEEQLAALQQRQDQEEARTRELTATLQEKERADAEMNASLVELHEAIENAKQEEVRLSQLLESARQERQDLREKKSSVEARLNSFREMRDSYEGFAEGVQAIMQAREEGRPEAQGIIGPVGDLISTRPEYQRAIEAALGASAHSIAIDRAEQARDAVRFLVAQEAGRVTFLPLDTLRVPEGAAFSGVYGQPGVIASVIDVLQFDERLRPIMRHLFGSSLLVRTLDDALRLYHAPGAARTIVTLDGEILSPSGAITGGRSGGEGQGLLGRSAEIEEMEKAVEGLSHQIAATTEREQTISTDNGAIKNRIEQLSQEAAARRDARAELNAETARISAELQGLAQSAEALVREREMLRTRLDELARRRTESIEIAASMEREGEALGEEMADRQQAASHARVAQAELASQLSDMRVQQAGLTQSIEETERQRRQLQQQHESTLAEVEKRTTAVEEFEANRTGLESDTRENLERSRALAESKEEARKLVVEAENQRQALLNDSEALEARLKTIRDEVRDTQTRVHKLEIDLRHDEDQLRFFQERIQAEYHVALGSLTAEQVGTDEYDEKVRDELLAQIREKLERIGTVNLMAIEEYEALTERHEFLVTQQQDLDQAREALMSVVEKIDATIKEMFLETFNAVAENFKEYFRRVFAGGKARIYLVDEEDPLECGIEIEARPPGKKPQLLSLLSGGEQAMTAIALLFAIFKAKPSPFCVLDEVDAPLDDANIGRFVELVDEFCVDTQFVVITHNKQTMARADALYGVTQQERGVSQIVSVRIDDAHTSNTAA